MSKMMMDRRLFLGGAAAAGLALPGVSFASPNTEKRFVLIIQRGAQDGIHVLPPYGDPQYKALRKATRIPTPGQEGGALKLDGLFGMHPELGALAKLYRQKELIVFPAIATGYRGRSHFDGQNQLENGSNRPYGSSSGFLNRALRAMPSQPSGLSMGLNYPLAMNGKAQVWHFAPTTMKPPSDDFLARVEEMYADDPVLLGTLDAELLESAVSDLGVQERNGISSGRDLPSSALVAGRLLAKPDGPRIAILSSEGWDSHSQLLQKSLKLMPSLNRAVANLQTGLGSAWKDTVVMTVSEFGRTAAENGSRGSDHGTGGVSFLFGGAVEGGRIMGDWAGLRPQDLLDGRDVRPTVSTESVLKGVLGSHLGIPEGHLEETVFPGSRTAAAQTGLLKA
ncbi:DUF1501 domain-containing protein [Parvularcula maris]|uniref:DUF1501 domain-containing protein n=1 Tax=Parvularcula maris TaxID=2965077 RepID=A0A9X2RK07_9PROT|nr:DUF1501 domain-containing protein [Parvularcula maris]MCQ8185283.1 DUF1501 domain-containing protein [Parvularcula maris]